MACLRRHLFSETIYEALINYKRCRFTPSELWYLTINLTNSPLRAKVSLQNYSLVINQDEDHPDPSRSHDALGCHRW